MRSQRGDGPAQDRDKRFLEKPQAVISVAGGAVAILVASLGLVFGFFLGCKRQPPPPKLELSDVDVAREKDIAADWTSGDEPRPAMNDWTSSLLSIALRNRSEDKVLVTEAEFAINAVTQLGCPYGAGGSVVKARYDIKIPDLRTPPFTVTRPLKFEVPPHDNERIGFTVGPETVPDGSLPRVYSFTVTLSADDKSRLTTAPVVLMNPQGTASVLDAAEEVMSDGTGFVKPACVREQARKAREIVEGATLVSPELTKYSDELNRLAALPTSG
ncbi:hypothetical protein [Streptomyces lasiicapitis]|uniref:Uncharacterized protein n=1 Tax=Streptomyces lasiicapitis TaxID=1923961 RepID=A0ABQ2MWJ4_9ACTN|nr:hypothetical protein [Streptomyces lasiicapitis]GGO58851.1 hypothetical protein GCM10012286_79100 [Streptomyces lasiicapitis]